MTDPSDQSSWFHEQARTFRKLARRSVDHEMVAHLERLAIDFDDAGVAAGIRRLPELLGRTASE